MRVGPSVSGAAASGQQIVGTEVRERDGEGADDETERPIYSRIQTASNGVELTEVRSGTSTEKAGLRTGDVITAIDGTAVTNASQLSATIDAKSSGDTVK